ncbi:MAG: hypothetical protein ABI680_12495 [Chthoniobacteraceae bacterium]
MRLEARVTPIWKKQKLFVSLFILGFAAYFFWDGAIGYPAKNARYVEWKKFRDAGRTEDWLTFAKDQGWKPNEWTAYAEEHGWREPYPAVALGPEKIREQFQFGILGTVIGLAILAYWFLQKGRVLTLEDGVVTSPSGVRVPYGAVKGLGLKKWDSKGLATVRYEVDGKSGSFVIDDYKFDPEPTRKILDEIKNHLAPPEIPSSPASEPDAERPAES